MKRRAFLTLGIGIFYLIISFSVNFLFSTIYGSISGKVIGEDTGEGIKRIHIVLYTLDGYTVAFANTDKEGNFQFRMLKEGYYSLQFVPPSPYLLSPYWNKSRQERLKDGKVKLEKGQNIHIVKSLKVGGIISGFVYKEDGVTPLEGVQIVAFPKDKYWDIPGVSSTTDLNGRYTIIRLEPLSNYVLQATQHAPHFHFPLSKFNVKVEAKRTTEVNFIFNMQDSTRIIGRVVSGVDGNPLPSSDIFIDKYRVDLKKFIEIHAFNPDKEGKFSIIGIEPGIYKIKARDYNSGIEREDKKEIEIHIEKGEVKEITFLLDLPSK